jgi:methionyl-tRNA formyltransferase
MSGPSGSWRIILFTDLPPFAAWYKAYFAAQGHNLVATVTSSKRAKAFPYLDIIGIMQPEVDVLVSGHPRRWAAQLAPLRPDLIVATVFPWKLPPELLALPRLGAVNVHPTLLPRYRGTDTPIWLLHNGERETGMTLHRMSAQLDVGPILAQVTIPIDDDDQLETLLPKFFAALGPVWEQATPRIAAGDPGDPQDESQASYYGRIADERAWKTIDWTQPARTVHNVVRGAAFQRDLPPGAVGHLEGVPHRITQTRLLPGSKGDGPPGAVVARDDDMLLVQCGDGLLGVVAYEVI